MTKTISAAAPLITITGKGKAQRETAFIRIAVDSFMSEQSRGALIATLNVALGNEPSDEQKAVAKQEYTIGRVASRLPAGEFPKGMKDNADKLEHARALVCSYAAPSNASAGATPKLRKGKIGWRSAVQHRVIRNAEESWSLIAAELNIGGARTMAEKNEKQARGKQVAPIQAAGAKGKSVKAATPDHALLVKPAKPTTADEAVNHVMTQMSQLLAYANKYAGVMPTVMGEAVMQAKKLVNDAGNTIALEKAAALK